MVVDVEANLYSYLVYARKNLADSLLQINTVIRDIVMID